MRFNFRHTFAAAMLATSLTSISAVMPAMAQTSASDTQFREQILRVFRDNPSLFNQIAQQSQQAEQLDRVAALLKTAGPVSEQIIKGDKQVPFKGNPKGQPVVEYFDYNCGYCKKFDADTAKPLLAKNPNIKLILVLTPILGPGSERMAEFAAASMLQGKFAAAHDFLILQHAAQISDADALKDQLVTAAGLDRAAFDKALANGTAKAIVDHNMQLSKTAGVSGTPMIYANGKVAPGAIPLEPLEEYLRN